MFCQNCGSEIPPGGRFCRRCGAQIEIKPMTYEGSQPDYRQEEILQSKPPVSKKKKKPVLPIISLSLVFILAAVLILQNFGVIGTLRSNAAKPADTSVSETNETSEYSASGEAADTSEEAAASASASYEGDGYDSAEEAVLAYLDALKAQDASAMLSTFAIETFVENADTEYMLTRLRIYQTSHSSYGYSLTDTDYEKQLCVLMRSGTLAQQSFYLLRLIYEGDYNATVALTEEGSIDEFLETYENSWFADAAASLTFVEFLEPSDLLDSDKDEYRKELLNTYKEQYGCDEIQDIAAHITIDSLTIDGETYENVDVIQCMTCACYNGKWYNVDLNGPLAAYLGCPSYSAGLYIYE